MLEITLLDFFARSFWEALLFLICVLSFCNVKIRIPKLLLYASILSVFIYLIRLLPINNGVHTMFILVILNLMNVFLFHIRIEQSIKASLIVTCILFAAEGINVLGLRLIFGDKFLEILEDPIKRIILTTPALILFALINFVFFQLFIKKKRLTDK